MSRYYQRPENALKKANEFIEVGKPTRALDTLYDVIKGKKHRAFSEKVIEPIMLKYLELCVELKKPHTAKEGLYQYRLMCQAVNVGLLEKVIRSFIKMAEERTESARDSLKSKVLLEQSQDAIVEVDDLDNLSMAEMTLLNVITEEQAQERSDRAALIPWVKFLWESYTQCLDLLRNNARLEKLYHDIAQLAFTFCLSYNRKTEFRKLCERLRKHFDDIVTRQNSQQMNGIDFSSPETQQWNMETRLFQLDSAITMELWQEAYKAIEDIHLLMNQSKKSQTRMMAYYYQKLSLVFWKSGNLLFHAATLLKYYMLCKDMKKNVSQEELQKNASQVTLATLAIPFPVVHPEFERFVETDKGMMEKAQKLTTLLFLPQPPTRASLIRDLGRHGVLNNAIAPLQKLHERLEHQFNPLDLCQEVNQILECVTSAEEEYDYLLQYIPPLQDVALVRLIKQISQVYQSIDYDRLLEIAVFTHHKHLEQILVDAVRYNDMQISIDHQENCIRFGSSLAEAAREDLPEGPHLQDMPSENVRLQLVNVLNCLTDTVNMINPQHLLMENENLYMKIVAHYQLNEKQSHMNILQRQKIIVERREELERTAVDRENEEKWRNEQLQKQQLIQEQKRLETEREEREKKRQEMERQEFNTKKLKERMAQMANTTFGQKVFIKLKEENLETLDVETVMQRQQEEMAKEAKEHLTRMRAQEKRLDHLERAKRLEEIPVIEKFMKDKKERERKEWEAHEADRIAHIIEDRRVAVATRDRMKRMKTDKDTFLQSLLESRRHVYVEKLAEFDKRLAAIKVQRLEERKQQRKDERRQRFIDAKEEEQRRKDEEVRRVEEEKTRAEREKVQQEIDERNRIVLEKTQAKDREIEERIEREKRQVGEGWRTPARGSSSFVGVTPNAPPASGVYVPAHKRNVGRKAEDDGGMQRDFEKPKRDDGQRREIEQDHEERRRFEVRGDRDGDRGRNRNQDKWERDGQRDRRDNRDREGNREGGNGPRDYEHSHRQPRGETQQEEPSWRTRTAGGTDRKNAAGDRERDGRGTEGFRRDGHRGTGDRPGERPDRGERMDRGDRDRDRGGTGGNDDNWRMKKDSNVRTNNK